MKKNVKLESATVGTAEPLQSTLILIEIDKARDSYNSLFNMYVRAETPDTQNSYRKMLDNQRKSLEELIKMYRKSLEREEDSRWDNE